METYVYVQVVSVLFFGLGVDRAVTFLEVDMREKLVQSFTAISDVVARSLNSSKVCIGSMVSRSVPFSVM